MTIEWHSDEELRTLAGGPEGELVERKENANGDGPRKTVCAFANDLHDRRKPGVLFIGADDKTGKPVGLPINEELLNALDDFSSSGDILPPPSLRVAPLSVEGGQVACAQVMPSNSPPVKFKGRIYIRGGASTRVAEVEDERVLSEKRRFRDAPFELYPFPAAEMEKDLDLVRFEREYLPALLPPDILAENDRTLEQRLAAAKMIAGADDPVPTTLGLLVLGARTLDFLPGAHVQFLRIDGDELGENIIDAEEISGTVAEIVRNAENKMRAYNRRAVNYVNVSRERRQWLYPPAALAQIFRNAVLHRSYESALRGARPVDVRWYNNRVEIISPGGPFGAASGAEFPQEGLREYRNPGLAEAMKALELVQRYGTGVGQARRAMAENGNPPLEFSADQHTVICTLRPASSSANQKASDQTVIAEPTGEVCKECTCDSWCKDIWHIRYADGLGEQFRGCMGKARDEADLHWQPGERTAYGERARRVVFLRRLFEDLERQDPDKWEFHPEKLIPLPDYWRRGEGKGKTVTK